MKQKNTLKVVYELIFVVFTFVQICFLISHSRQYKFTYEKIFTYFDIAFSCKPREF